jgi:Na+/melibiose symporter-like transporter
VYAYFYVPHENVPVVAVLFVFVTFMIANGLRNVSYNTLTSKVPDPSIRARFQSFQSAAQHGASAVAAIASAQLLSESVTFPATGGEPVKRLIGMPQVALASIGLSLIVPVLLFVVERGVRQRSRRIEPGPE